MKNIILDTDFGPDCDDAGALALLARYADMGLCRILGVGHCTSNPYGAGAIDATLEYLGRHDIPVGTWTGREFLNEDYCRRYNEPIAKRLPNRYIERPAEDVVRMYRRLLSKQPDGSVEYIAIGPLNSLSALLDSAGDDISPLSGRELIRAKVTKLTMMAGIFRPSDAVRAAEAEEKCGRRIEEYAEYNVVCDAAASMNVADNWPTPKAYLGWEAGLMESGECLAEKPAEHPVRMAYELWNGAKRCRRCSWDPMTVVYAVAGAQPYVRDSAAGQIRFTAEGYTEFKPDANGVDRFAELTASDEEITAYIDGLLSEI